ncbi:probable pectinesterase 29 [Ananas comosus]|uniref:Pectinesterase n=2 Tax=Ananas comosus TaxID=4615 RepID=A0A6P5ESM6_ANACO|nr:probable pectinesterase 29 [Ananas comosus]CAD1829462.1 unnamed protein product [Ananas comosus var. bracteatus]
MTSGVFFCLFFVFFFFFLTCDLLHISFTEGAATVEKTVVVDQGGLGNFKTIQEAINSIPDQNTQWIEINVKSGVYREKVSIPASKPYILLQGNGMGSTVIDWNGHSDNSSPPSNGSIAAFPLASTFDSATFTVLAENFVARDITFKNSYNINNDAAVAQAVAALVGGDKSAFYRCGFQGYQDTLCDFLGRHYFSSCWIEGAVDFIFGFAQSIYVSSSLWSTIQGPQPGWLTAHAKVNDTSEGGSNMTFAESNCTGLGANRSQRVKWEKALDPKQLEYFVSNTFIDKEGWLAQQP